MIAAYLRHLQYMSEARSWQWVAKETGIGSKALRQIRAGKLAPGSDYSKKIKNIYHREAYSRLRESGFSAKNAKIYSQYRPELASAYQMQMQLKIGDLALGKVAVTLENKGLKTTKANINRYYDKTFEGITKGISNSDLSFEEIQDY